MDFLTSKEIDGLKADIKASEAALEAEKYTFEKMLKEKIGPKMIEELNKKEQPKPEQKKKKKFSLRNLFCIYK